MGGRLWQATPRGGFEVAEWAEWKTMAGRETCSVARVNVFNQRNLISRLVFLLASLSHSLTAVAVVHSFVVQRAAPSYQWPGASVGLEQPTTANRGRQGLKKKWPTPVAFWRVSTGLSQSIDLASLSLAGTFNLVEPTITRGDSAVWRLNHRQQMAKPPILLLWSIRLKGPITVRLSAARWRWLRFYDWPSPHRNLPSVDWLQLALKSIECHGLFTIRRTDFKS